MKVSILYQSDEDGEKDIMTVPGASHAQSVNTDPEAYWKKVWGFVGNYIDLDKKEESQCSNV